MHERAASVLTAELILLREGVASLRAAADQFERLRAMPAAQRDTGVLGALERASVQSEAWALAVEQIGRRWLLRPIRAASDDTQARHAPEPG